ncbi:hypothetical protein [Tsukamurella pulmonis]|uniref:hypothetical protein n=1 Tax=Tsukamurella pulmonis TaxID=47312 RepID=UPI0012E866E8|nr:hypothetical protein [Tsukamurella pulmonis]
MTVRMRGAAAMGILLGALTGCSSDGPSPRSTVPRAPSRAPPPPIPTRWRRT